MNYLDHVYGLSCQGFVVPRVCRVPFGSTFIQELSSSVTFTFIFCKSEIYL